MIIKIDYVKDDSGDIEDSGGRLSALLVSMLQLVLRQGPIADSSNTSCPTHTPDNP